VTTGSLHIAHASMRHSEHGVAERSCESRSVYDTVCGIMCGELVPALHKSATCSTSLQGRETVGNEALCRITGHYGLPYPVVILSNGELCCICAIAVHVYGHSSSVLHPAFACVVSSHVYLNLRAFSGSLRSVCSTESGTMTTRRKFFLATSSCKSSTFEPS
jgi:hypothetical protein